MKRSITISPNVYPVKFVFIFGITDKVKIMECVKGIRPATRKAVTEQLKDVDLSQNAGTTIMYSTLSLIIIPVWKGLPSDYATLQHEITHAVMHAGEKCGFKLSTDSWEFYCYMTDYLTEKIYIKLWA